MSEAILSAISVISGVCAIVFGYIAFVRNRDSDKTKEAKSDATILTELGYIKGGIDTHMMKTSSRSRMSWTAG